MVLLDYRSCFHGLVNEAFVAYAQVFCGNHSENALRLLLHLLLLWITCSGWSSSGRAYAEMDVQTQKWYRISMCLCHTLAHHIHLGPIQTMRTLSEHFRSSGTALHAALLKQQHPH